MNKKIIIFACLGLLLNFPLVSEARGGFNGIITAIKDPKAMEAYAKEIQQLTELYEQGRKMQTQIEQLQQSLEHYNFKDLEQTYNFLAGTVDDFENIQKQYIGMNISAQEMKDNWDELNEEYDSKNMSQDELDKLKEKQEQRRKASAEYRAKLLASIEDTEKARKELQAYKQDLALLDTGKASPIKAIQMLGQMMTYQANEIKKAQKLAAEEMRKADEEANRKQQEEKAIKAKAQHDSEVQSSALNVVSKEDWGTRYGSAILSYEEITAAKASSNK